jgi:hypothetical protein
VSSTHYGPEDLVELPPKGYGDVLQARVLEALKVAGRSAEGEHYLEASQAVVGDWDALLDVTRQWVSLRAKGEILPRSTSRSGVPDSKRCPFCDESVRFEAVKCRHCGEFLAVTSGSGTNGFAVASLVLGILWLIPVCAIFAVVFGHVALQQLGQPDNSEGGRGMAVAGLVLGYLPFALIALFAVLWLWNPVIG